jgi:hypothetical protein
MMTYTAKRLEDQTLMFKITTEHNGKEISFNVVCANNESEIPDLVDVYINFLDATPPVYSQQTPIADLNTIVQELTARLEALENK